MAKAKKMKKPGTNLGHAKDKKDRKNKNAPKGKGVKFGGGDFGGGGAGASY
jgi:uncharacterized membrane protein YgcG